MQSLKSLFHLRDDIHYLNFGSFGACPKAVFEVYQQFQLELEQEPVLFIAQNGLQYLEQSRKALGTFINCDPDDVVYVTNPSYAVNAVARSMQLQSGDEVLTTDLEYGACDRTWDYYCRMSGANYIRVPTPLPLESQEQFVRHFISHINSNTKVIFLSHITSTTALRLPVEEICKVAKERGIIIFIDGAHAPGQLPIDMRAMDVDYYTGACHKWMMTPKGSSFLYAKRDKQAHIDPLVISWGYNYGQPTENLFLNYHQMNGTRDYTAFLCIPAAIQFMKDLNWEVVASHCRELIRQNADRYFNILQTNALAPFEEGFIMQMLSAEIKCQQPEALHDLLFQKYKIQIPAMRHGNKVFLRFSINGFNDLEDINALCNALEDIISTTDYIKL